MDARRFETVFFDLGNTLVYFDGDWHEVMRQANRALVDELAKTDCRFPYPQFSAALHERLKAYYRERETDFIEDTTYAVVQGLLADFNCPHLNHEQVRAALDAMYAVSQAHWLVEADAIPMLKTLRERGYRLGIISNAADASDVHGQVERAHLKPYFDLVLVSADVGIRKPHPRIFELALAHFGVDPARAVMIGDTLGADILGALNSGMASVWITRRADNEDNNAQRDIIQPDRMIGALSELPDLLDSW